MKKKRKEKIVGRGKRRRMKTRKEMFASGDPTPYALTTHISTFRNMSPRFCIHKFKVVDMKLVTFEDVILLTSLYGQSFHPISV
jgi:hypothetical protein